MINFNSTLLRWLFLLLIIFPLATSFTSSRLIIINNHHQGASLKQLPVVTTSITLLQAQPTTAAEEAQRLLERSRALREEIAQQESSRPTKSTASTCTNANHSPIVSKWSVPPADDDDDASVGVDYRLYVDIGREEGTWMEPRWGASGKRIEFTLDVRFQPDTPASEEARRNMVQDNKSGNSSPVLAVESAPAARLRKGFDQMKCTGGAYRIDRNSRGQSDTLRFYVEVDGTPERSSFGDLFVPQGRLYFSIPCFGGSVQQLSAKGDMPVTVRQYGWHTGWRREESRIVGIFKAVPMADAKRKDGF